MECFKQDVRHFFAQSEAVGCNVTAPFKELAFQLAQSHDKSAKAAKAVNTLYLNEEGELLGANTDGAGLVSDIQRNIGSLKQLKVVLLGAGGAARGVINPLIEAGAASITIANRTFQKADMLAKEINLDNVTALPLEHCNDNFHIVINATSAGLTGSLPETGALSFASVKLTYDMVYKKELTNFLQFAQQNGSYKVCDGLGMLVGQAAKSFEIWTGYNPNIEPLMIKLRDQM